jgi:hypothetical protein
MVAVRTQKKGPVLESKGTLHLVTGWKGAGTLFAVLAEIGHGAGGGTGGQDDPLMPAGSWPVDDRINWLKMLVMGFQVAYGRTLKSKSKRRRPPTEAAFLLLRRAKPRGSQPLAYVRSGFGLPRSADHLIAHHARR